MRFLIIYNGKIFLTEWFVAENNYEAGMTVIDLYKEEYTTDGTTWNEIERDHL